MNLIGKPIRKRLAILMFKTGIISNVRYSPCFKSEIFNYYPLLPVIPLDIYYALYPCAISRY